MKLLLLGAGGQLGTELIPVLGRLGELTALSRAQLDIGNRQALRDCVTDLAPDVLVNAAAYTAVDAAEKDAECAFRINAQAVGEMAELLSGSGGLLVHYSTDYVFDGRADRPYTENDIPAPLNVYGASKLAGEERVRAAGVRHLILRTSWVYAQHGRNFLLTMLRMAATHDRLRVVADQTGAPTWARDLALATGSLLGRCLGPAEPPDWSGTYHLTAGGATTWADFAREIFRVSAAGRDDACPVVQSITSTEYGAPAARPACSLLDNAKLHDRFGIKLPDWDVALRQCLALMPPRNTSSSNP